MAPFIHDDFLLESDTAADLYHGFAAHQPIIDYHCHLSPEQMATDHRFRTITELWLDGDHYKWRAMRANGVPERFCTGDASDWEKFEAWAAHRARHAAQPAVPLDPHGAAPALRHRRAARPGHGARRVRAVQREARRARVHRRWAC